MREITDRLFSMQDTEYRDFHSRLMPNIEKECIIGVRIPKLRAYAKELSKTSLSQAFLEKLPHKYYEENNLHALLIDALSDPEEQLKQLERFLPHVDNWATCDLMRPRALFKCPQLLLSAVYHWIESERTYTVRFAVSMLLCRFLDEDFKEQYLELVAGVRSEQYYIQMMQAWYFATALAKQPDAALPYITEKRLPIWVHNKTIQKAVESYRISKEQKAFLKTLRIKSDGLRK